MDNTTQTPSSVPQTGTPPVTGNTPAVEPQEETVTLPKSKAEKLQELEGREAEITRREQALKKRSQRSQQRTQAQKPVRKPNPTFAPKADVEEEDEDAELVQAREQAQLEREVVKVERGVLGLFKKSEYKEFFEKNPILSQQLENDPLGFYIFKLEPPMDAEDAIARIEEYLDDESAKFVKPVVAKQGEGATSTPAPAPTNPPTQEKKQETQPTNVGQNVSQVDRVSKGLFTRLMGNK